MSQLDSQTQSQLDSQAQSQLESPAQPQLDPPAQSQIDPSAQSQIDSPAQPKPAQPKLDSPTQTQLDSPTHPNPLLTIRQWPQRHSHKGPAKKPPSSPRKPQREARKRLIRQCWKDFQNSRNSEEDVDDPDGITVAPDDSTNETTAGFSGFSLNNDARPKRQRNPLLEIQQMASLHQPASSKRVSRPPGASENAAPPPTPVEAPEGGHVDPLDRTILNLDTPKPVAGKVYYYPCIMNYIQASLTFVMNFILIVTKKCNK